VSYSRQRDFSRQSPEEKEFEDRVLRVDRVRKTVKGGRIPSSRVMVAVGDGRGRVGIAMGKARQAPDAIRKAIERAKKRLIRVPLDGYTIPHEVVARQGGAVILLRPASRGTGIIAGGAVRQIVELAGIRDILSKSLGSQNVMNRAKACFRALESLKDPRNVAEVRGKTVEEMRGRPMELVYAEETEDEEAEGDEEEQDGDSES
jgi:small subunit ribosomal protein S5